MSRWFMAMAALEALIAGVLVRCEGIERDRHGRLVAKCFAPNGLDIGGRMVAAGWVLAYRRHSTDYVDAEAEARAARRGMWRGRFAAPWKWRKITASQIVSHQQKQLALSGSCGPVSKMPHGGDVR